VFVQLSTPVLGRVANRNWLGFPVTTGTRRARALADLGVVLRGDSVTSTYIRYSGPHLALDLSLTMVTLRYIPGSDGAETEQRGADSPWTDVAITDALSPPLPASQGQLSLSTGGGADKEAAHSWPLVLLDMVRPGES
jgi:hypothetical protein